MTEEDAVTPPAAADDDARGGWLALARAVQEDIKVHDVPSLAAGVAFKIFLALFPSLLAFLAVVSLVADPEALLEAADEVIPPAALELLAPRIEGVAATGGAGALLTLGVLGGLWAASSAAVTLMKAMTRIQGAVEQRGFLAQRAVALLLTLALLLALALLVALVALGPQVRQVVLGVVDLGGLGGPLLGLLQGALAVLVLILLLTFVYWAAPDVSGRARRWISPGAVVGAIGWLVLSSGFSIYTQTAANYEATYAGLAGVIVTLVWLQLSMLVLLLGAQVDATLQARQEGSERGSAALLLEGAASDHAPAAEAPHQEPATAGAPARPTEASEASDEPPRAARLPAALAGLGALAAAAAIGLRLRR